MCRSGRISRTLVRLPMLSLEMWAPRQFVLQFDPSMMGLMSFFQRKWRSIGILRLREQM